MLETKREQEALVKERLDKKDKELARKKEII